MPTNRFSRVYQSPVVDLAQSQHIILANTPTAAQEVMNLAGAIYPFTVTNNAASRSYGVLKAFLLVRHASAWSGKLER
jgi:hypothetical protein